MSRPGPCPRCDSPVDCMDREAVERAAMADFDGFSPFADVPAYIRKAHIKNARRIIQAFMGCRDQGGEP